MACGDPETCMEKCGNKLGCSNYAYPLLVTKILPPGATGIILAAIMSALMSTLTSILNSKCMGNNFLIPRKEITVTKT